MKPKSKKDWLPPKGSWENDVNSIDAVEETDMPNGETQVMGYLIWNNNKRTKHDLLLLHEKCPRKVRWDWQSATGDQYRERCCMLMMCRCCSSTTIICASSKPPMDRSPPANQQNVGDSRITALPRTIQKPSPTRRNNAI